MSTDLHLLLHDLGNNTDQERVRYLFRPGTTLLIENSGAGKTRLVLEGLCNHWGFISCSTKDKGAASGSHDFETAVDTLLMMSTWSQNKDEEEFRKNREAAKRVFAMLLYPRASRLTSLWRHVPAQTDVKTARRRLVLLQVMPPSILDPLEESDDDIFAMLFKSLRYADTGTILPVIWETLYSLNVLRKDLFPVTEGSTSFFAIIDEAQAAADNLREYFHSSDDLDLPFFASSISSFTRLNGSKELFSLARDCWRE